MSLIKQAENVFDHAGDVQSSLDGEGDRGECLKRIRDLKKAIKDVPPPDSSEGHGDGGTVAKPVHDLGDTLGPLETAVEHGKFGERSDFDGFVEELRKAISQAKADEESKP